MKKIKEKIKEFCYKEYQIKQLALVFILLLFLLGIASCSISEYKVNTVYKEKQAACEHDWFDLGYGAHNGMMMEHLYCPKCKADKYLHYVDWQKFQIDMEYNKQTK